MQTWVIDKILELTRKSFGTDTDPSQIQPTKETYEKLMDLHPDSISYRLNSKGELMGYFAVIPTTEKLMNDFVSGKITEKEMFARTEKQEKPEAIYLGGAVVLPEYRRKGLAKEMALEAVNKVSGGDKKIKMFYWAFSEEGRKLAKSIEKELGIKAFAANLNQ